MHSSSFIYTFLFIIIICCIFIPFYQLYPDSFAIDNSISSETIDISSDYVWPVPGYTRITSKFGKRNSPTAGASSYHLGIDVGAPAGSALVAITSGQISFVGFKGANGFMITLISDKYVISYCHVSPDIIVSIGDTISKGEIIGYVGPKNVYGIENNPYKDSRTEILQME